MTVSFHSDATSLKKKNEDIAINQTTQQGYTVSKRLSVGKKKIY